MSSTSIYSMTEEDLTRFANQVKELLLTAEEAGECAVVVTSQSILGKLWDKARGVNEANAKLQLHLVFGRKP